MTRALLEQALEALNGSVDLVRNEYEWNWRHGIPTRKAQLDSYKHDLEVHEKVISDIKAELAKPEDSAEIWHRRYMEATQQHIDRVAVLGGEIEALEADLQSYQSEQQERKPVCDTTPSETVGFNRAVAHVLLTAASKSGDPGAIELAAQLAGAAPCRRCGYVHFNCRCLDKPEAQQERKPDTLCDRLQQKCVNWNTYWRAPDAHGVVLSQEQANELLRDALGVEVEIKAQQERKPEQCEWKPEDPDIMPGTYASACGELWTFIDGGPNENRVRFCQGCGKPVALKDAP